jgi:hypothetical protein
MRVKKLMQMKKRMTMLMQMLAMSMSMLSRGKEGREVVVMMNKRKRMKGIMKSKVGRVSTLMLMERAAAGQGGKQGAVLWEAAAADPTSEEEEEGQTEVQEWEGERQEQQRERKHVQQLDVRHKQTPVQPRRRPRPSLLHRRRRRRQVLLLLPATQGQEQG